MYISARASPTDVNNGPVPSVRSGCGQRPMTTPPSQRPERPSSSSLGHRPSLISSSIPSSSSNSSSLESIPIPTPTPSKALPVTTTTPAILIPTNGLVPTPDGSGLNSGALIGATLGSLFGFILVICLLDILLLSNRMQSLLRLTGLSRARFLDEKRPPLPPRPVGQRWKPLPDPQSSYYDKEIKHSRSLSLDSSGYSSRYSRSTWGWSGGNGGTTLRDSRDWYRQSVDLHRYSVFDEDEDGKWEEARASYRGNIRPGMGVQKRYTGFSFLEGTAEDIELDGKDEGFLRRAAKWRTWMLDDPQERWRKGIHPLTGKRGAEFSRVGYY